MLYDIVLYQQDGGHLLECDTRAALDVVKHLKKYALRSKVPTYCWSSSNNTVLWC